MDPYVYVGTLPVLYHLVCTPGSRVLHRRASYTIFLELWRFENILELTINIPKG